jgi:shikimate kinase
MLIFLVGMPGCGKTTIAKSLAHSLNISLVDLDAEIVKSEGRSIESIFETDGEDIFRKIEKDIVERFSKTRQSVISTGGGAPCFYNNMDIMNQAGITVYLNVPAEELAKRILRQDTNRPMVKGKSKEELIEFLKLKISEREVFYNKAQFKISGIAISAADVLNQIKAKLH